MDDTINYMCIWHQSDVMSISPIIHWHLFSDFSSFHSPVKEINKQRRIMGLPMAQWINRNRKNRSVLSHWYSVRKTGPILLLLVDLIAGREADKIQVDFKTLKFSAGSTIQIFVLFNITAMLLHRYNCISVGFCHVKLILRCGKNSFAIFFMSILTIRYQHT